LANVMAGGSVMTDRYTEGIGYYVGTILFAVVVAGLANANYSRAIRLIDRWLGELAYPVFLTHWLVGFMLVVTIMPGATRGWGLTFAAIPLTLVMSHALVVLNRRWIDPVRTQIRNSGADAVACSRERIKIPVR
jgi:peptidoglycan/LPS O-acetylase OafA/YrhL